MMEAGHGVDLQPFTNRDERGSDFRPERSVDQEADFRQHSRRDQQYLGVRSDPIPTACVMSISAVRGRGRRVRAWPERPDPMNASRASPPPAGAEQLRGQLIDADATPGSVGRQLRGEVVGDVERGYIPRLRGGGSWVSAPRG